MQIHKKPSANNNEDFISELPDALLIQILSLLPESDANQTRILSKRWKNLYAFLPNLHFVLQFRWPMEQVITFYDFIDQTLSIRNNVPIQSFFLDSFKNCESTRLYRCLSTVVHLKVQQLYIRLTDDIYCDSIRFDCELFKTCNTLVELTLTGGFELVVPNQAGLLFPSLKKLVLIIVAYSREAFTNLISGCPVLEELIAERKIVGKRDNFAYIFCSRSLKRLTIRISSIYVYKAVIDAPKLEYLYISDKNFVLTEPLSLVEAHISYASRYADQLLSCLSSAKILTLTNTTIQALSYDYFNLPMLPNLVKLVIGIDCLRHSHLLLALLNRMGNLEHITFSDGISAKGLSSSSWYPPLDPPACLWFNMKEIIIHNGEAVRQEELTFISYLLKHSYKLEKLTIIAHNIDPEKREQLLNFSRGSMCQIELV